VNKTLRTYIIILLLLFIGAIAIEFSTPVPIDWSRTYNEKHSIPFGLKVFKEQLANFSGVTEVIDIKTSPYEFFTDEFDWDDSTYTAKGTFFHIDEYSDIDSYSLDELISFVGEGNSAFISSTYPPFPLMDSLHTRVINEEYVSDSITLKLANKALTSDTLLIKRGFGQAYFSELDTLNTTVLGYQQLGDTARVNFIKINYKEEGAFYIHLQPTVFTNYHLLKNNNYQHTEAVLSYLPAGTVYYDLRNKPSKLKGNSELRFILSQPSLKWAWIVGLLSLIIFMIFNAKRRQRIIKVIQPLENTTVQFIKTIGNLYFESNDHKNLIDKKITYFLETLRRTYHIDTQIMDEKFVNLLAKKSGKDEIMIGRLTKLISQLKARRHVNEADLLRISKMIEKFNTA
jgi:ribosomal protein L35